MLSFGLEDKKICLTTIKVELVGVFMCDLLCLNGLKDGTDTVLSLQIWPLGREINCRCLKTLSVSENRSISLQPRLQFDGRYIVCSSDLGVYQWDFASFEILR